MACWHRITQSKLSCLLSNQFKRYCVQAPFASSPNCSAKHTRKRLLENPAGDFFRRAIYFHENVRFFSVQAWWKDLRVNKDIQAQTVRLVTDEGHKIVSRYEALELSRKLKLDLVEVQKNAKPPVCKIMDFRREIYKKQLKDKERTKIKSEETLRKGGFKEVRISKKIEQKDLKMKADTVIRLMERRYRVKCMAVGTGKEGEDEDLGGLLSRLTSLLEDVAVVESGPIVERKQAFVVVRHTKFGLSKKGGGKKLKVIGDGQVQNSTSQPVVDSCLKLPNEDSAESDLEDEQEIFNEDDSPLSFPMQMQVKDIKDKKVASSITGDFNEVSSLNDEKNGPASSSTDRVRPSMPVKIPSPGNYGASNFMHPKPVFDSKRMDTNPSFRPHEPRGTENRYMRNEPGNRFPPTRLMDNKHPNMTRESVRSEPWRPRERQLPFNVNTSSSMSAAETKQTPKQQSSCPGIPDPSGTSYGIFSNQNANSHREQDAVANIHQNRDRNPYSPGPNSSPSSTGTEAHQKFQSSKPDTNQKTGRWGVFSSESSNVIQQNK